MAERVKVNTMPADEGVRIMLDMLKGKWITELWGRNVVIAVSGANHSTRNGKEYYFSKEEVVSLQEVAHKAGVVLMGVALKDGVCSWEECPYCSGEDWVTKFKVLRNYVSLPYIFQNLMGWSMRRQKMYLSDKKEKTYNAFTEDQIAEVNRCIREMALTLCSMEFEWQERPGVDVGESEEGE